MVRKNEKKHIVNYENSIQKSNEFSFSRLSSKLTLNQMQLLAFAIYCTQQNETTMFNKIDFEKKFNLGEYRTEYAYRDSRQLLTLQVSVRDFESNKFKLWNVFTDMEYDNGQFIFEWNKKIVPHILELKERFITLDFTITNKFKSEFSWILYDELKILYGYWHKSYSKEELMKLFKVQDRKTYQKNTGDFKKKVLDIAIAEINEYTEFEIWYKEEKKGRSIVGFDLHWSSGTSITSATKKQITEIKTIQEAVFDDMFKYVNLNNEESRERAIQLIKELESYREFTSEPICITKEHADFLIKKGKANLQMLEQMLEYERQKPKVPFYNWLDERD